MTDTPRAVAAGRRAHWIGCMAVAGCLLGAHGEAALPNDQGAAPQSVVPPASSQADEVAAPGPLTQAADTISSWLAWAQDDLATLGDDAARAGWEVAIALGLNTAKMPETPAAMDVPSPTPDPDGLAKAELIGDEPPATAPIAPPAQSIAPDTPPPAAAPAANASAAEAAPAPAQADAAASAAPADATPAEPAADAKPAAEPAVATPAPPPAEAPHAPAALADADAGLLDNMVFDQAARLPTGAYFVPKPTQRLFGVRTLRVAASDVRPSVKLPGRIVPDPHSHGDVEASLLGRIEAGPAGLPVLGTHVSRGEVLGYVTPAIGVVDRTQVRREVARLTNEIRLETEAIERLKQFWFVPFRDGKIIQAQMKIAGLRRERDALLPTLQIREVLRASIDGVISRSTAVLGRITHPGEMIFEIVDPHSLWVEATAQDPQVAEMASQAAEATAATPEGEMLHLTFVGSGLTLEQQAVPLLLRIDDPSPSLRVDRPVTVTIHTNAMMRHGIVVPRSALVVGNDGISEVWVQNAPEEFAPYRVLSEDVDGTSVLIIGGLPDGHRVVVQGLKLLTALN